MHKPIAEDFLHRNRDLGIRWESVFSGIVCEIIKTNILMTKDRNIESGINKENDRNESAEGPNIDNQVLEASSFSSRVFIHDYPKNPRIEAQYKSKGRTYISYYNITALGTYSITLKLTQKPNCNNVPQYPIPDNYIVETEIAERGVKCETKYVSNSKVNYTVAWKKGRAEWSVNSTKSASAVVNLFLKKINWKNFKLSGPLADRRNEINKLINAQIPVEIFNIDQDVNQSNTNNYNSEIINDILVDNNEIGNGAFCSLVTLLKILISIWKKGENPVIIPGDTLYIKLGGDGRNVGRKQNHVMITFCLLNEGEEVLKPDKQYSICLYIGKETYEILDRVGKIFALQLMDLKQNGIIDEDGNHWPIEFFFSGDWKFLYIIMGLNAPNSNYFCLYCECDIKSRHNMNLSWPPTGNKKGNKKSSIFPVIDLLNYIPDELHTLLRISDILMESLFKDLFRRNDFERNIKEKIEKKMSELNIHFEFYHNNSSRSSWSWTSLMGPDKKKILQHFPVKTFSQPARGQINTATAILGIYREEDVTPYMHMLTMHIPFFMRQLKEKNLAFRFPIRNTYT
ncbi:hypothetical protein Glove_27g60 [Diversispora epigaea]|uniref:Uncharacterized protein n=1 Tax=Diversispora epigaea TaxID=1348612 RepID=A0A397JI12_9GLOM|nr:hypothetical protein Glove_27g60 [Diversispora epigaea]